MNKLTTKQSTDIQKWSNIFSWAMEQAQTDLGYLVPIERLMIDPEQLADDERENIKAFEIKVYDFALMEWRKRLEQCRQIIGTITEHRERRALRWLEVENYQQVEQATRAIIQPDTDTSTGRQIESFVKNHMPVLDRAGVEPQQTMELIAREDSFVLAASRAIARIEKAELKIDAKNDQVRKLMDEAVTARHAGIIRSNWLGSDIKLPRDIMYAKDGTIFVTFICDSSHEFIELCQHTDNITDQHGNTMPILLETRDERTMQYAQTQLKMALGIIQSGDFDGLSSLDKYIVGILDKYGYVTKG